MQTIAFYLPQFHSIPENDRWWGKGYTEWVAVKSAQPLFQGHYQPRIPWNRNYYDLLDKQTFMEQARLMRDYSVDGLCIYHYYFADGRRILEKPAENLLQWGDIPIRFCFSWANETWARSWTKLNEKNVWNINKEKAGNRDDKDGILLKQEYGSEKDWKDHFNYLLPFFKDSRYIKKENKPVFVIHRADSIPCLPQMLNIWNVMAKENGFDGIYIIGSNARIRGLDAYVRQEPIYSAMNQFRLDYQWLSDQIVSHALAADAKTYLCGCPSYDDTPRRGREGMVCEGASADVFYKQMKSLYSIAEMRGHDFLFVNAWNEWGEGMYLEPDERFGAASLDALKRAKCDCQGAMNNDMEMELYKNALLQKKDHSEKTLELTTLYKMAALDHIEERLNRVFSPDKELTIALYGFGEMGKLLADLFRRAGISIQYGLDRRAEKVHMDFPVYKITDRLPEADYLIVALPAYYKEVFDDLRDRSMQIISVDYLIDMMRNVEM